MGIDNENNFNNWRKWSFKDWLKLLWAAIKGLLNGA
jgi:hypothetical protein